MEYLAEIKDPANKFLAEGSPSATVEVEMGVGKQVFRLADGAEVEVKMPPTMASFTGAWGEVKKKLVAAERPNSLIAFSVKVTKEAWTPLHPDGIRGALEALEALEAIRAIKAIKANPR